MENKGQTMDMGNASEGVSLWLGSKSIDSEERSRFLSDLRRVYGTTESPTGTPVIRVAFPWEHQYWNHGWPAAHYEQKDSERIRVHSAVLNPERYFLGTVIQFMTDTDFRWSVNQYIMSKNIIGEWEGRCRTSLDARLTVERILRENSFKLLETKHLLLG